MALVLWRCVAGVLQVRAELGPEVVAVVCNQGNSGGKTALHRAAWSGSTGIIKLLLDVSHVVGEPGPSARTCHSQRSLSVLGVCPHLRFDSLMTIVYTLRPPPWRPPHRHMGVGRRLFSFFASRLQAGADPNVLTIRGETPLHYACGGKLTNVDAIRLLLYHGGGPRHVNVTSTAGETPVSASPLVLRLLCCRRGRRKGKKKERKNGLAGSLTLSSPRY